MAKKKMQTNRRGNPSRFSEAQRFSFLNRLLGSIKAGELDQLDFFFRTETPASGFLARGLLELQKAEKRKLRAEKMLLREVDESVNLSRQAAIGQAAASGGLTSGVLGAVQSAGTRQRTALRARVADFIASPARVDMSFLVPGTQAQLGAFARDPRRGPGPSSTPGIAQGVGSAVGAFAGLAALGGI